MHAVIIFHKKQKKKKKMKGEKKIYNKREDVQILQIVTPQC